ncbi:unnamed protein product [Parajaminaea phylloscopi]
MTGSTDRAGGMEEGDKTGRPILLARSPSSLLSSCQLTHLAPNTADPPNHERALAQWKAYLDIYRSCGWEVLLLDELDEAPDGVFVEDAIIVFPNLDRTSRRPKQGGIIVVVRSGSEERRKEYPSALSALKRLGLEQRGYKIVDFHDPAVDPTGSATCDGGDILKILPRAEPPSGQANGSVFAEAAGVEAEGPTVLVGLSSRTNKEGFEVLRRELHDKRGWRVQGVPVEHHLHLKSATTALPGSLDLVVHPAPRKTASGGMSAGVPHPGIDVPPPFSPLPAPEETGIACVDLCHEPGFPIPDGKRGVVLISQAATGTKKELEARGYEVRTADVTEFEKMEGCVTCLSVRVRTPAPGTAAQS